MRQTVKRWINAALRPAGVQLVAVAQDERQALVDWLHSRSIGHVIDVGANCGQFAQQLLDKGFRGTVHCCEPLSEAHASLAARFATHSQVEVLPRTAIGAYVGKASMNVAGNSVSSSVRPMLEIHEKAAPRSAYVGMEEAPLTTLDAQFGGACPMLDQGVLLKIDTQGYEADVLRGASEVLPLCRGVLIELSTGPLYEGQALWDELHRMLTDSGFELWNLMPDFRDPESGRLLQFDGLYVRR
ncbi:FkbM family methyltransferase [Pontixanthobacter gangjinensis]|uniref:FkbM family methyltransferase n=1 Tax=Pontixanthobacter gangjinensis TaxID=1028742 RepID=A0A6I4SQQ6_9SPHN|nr:FkbM family methyltransferase [Pontixanthobacter gangjinensis]MXO57187.1 FkbM family methyltransferase [Pontixanthobacter gangjinensis]